MYLSPTECVLCTLQLVYPGAYANNYITDPLWLLEALALSRFTSIHAHVRSLTGINMFQYYACIVSFFNKLHIFFSSYEFVSNLYSQFVRMPVMSFVQSLWRVATVWGDGTM